MKITWQVSDGYVGGLRPQYTEIPDDELERRGSAEAREDFITDWVQEEFEQNISWSILKQGD